MKSLWQPQTRRELQNRIAKLAPDTRGRWGRMSPAQMIAHLTDSMRMALGELHVAPKRVPLRFPPLKQFALYYAPFPRGLPTAPELIARAPGDWSQEVGALAASIERFGAHDPDAAWPDHPAFGRLTGRQWGVLTYRHADHHLRQFGV